MAVRTLDSDDLSAEVGEPLGHDALRKAFVAAFRYDWCQADPYRLRPDERLVTSWELSPATSPRRPATCFRSSSRRREPSVRTHSGSAKPTRQRRKEAPLEQR